MNKVFAAFWYSGILPLLTCTTTIPTTTTTTTTFDNHESLSRPQSAKKAKKAGTKVKQQQNQSFEKELQEMQEKLQQLRIEKEQIEELLKAREETLKMKEEELEARRKEREKLQTVLKKLQKMKEFKPTMNREKELEKKDKKKKGFPQIIWLKDQWGKSKKEKDQQPMSPFLAFTTEAMRLLEEEQHLQLKKKKKDPLKPKTSIEEKTSMEARLRAKRAAVQRATVEARQRAFQKVIAEEAAFEARKCVERSVTDKSSACYKNGGMRQSSSFSGVEGESAQRCKARLERHRRTAERAVKALAEKNMRDLLAQREQAERNRLAEALDDEVKRWSSGKEGNLRALLSTLQYILGPDNGWQRIPLAEVITFAAVKKAYRKATLCVHPDKLQQRGASVQQKYICEKVFDLLKRSLEQIQLRGAVDGHCSISCSKGKLKLRDCQGRNDGERRRFISFASSLQTL
ncbi:unnamed protein product [Camellia sinensis]